MSARAAIVLASALALARCDDGPKADLQKRIEPGRGDASEKYQVAPAQTLAVPPGFIEADVEDLRFDGDLGIRHIVHLKNSGGTNVPSLAVLSADPEFSVDSGCGHGIGPGQSCPVSVTWNHSSVSRSSRILVSYRARAPRGGSDSESQEFAIPIIARAAPPAPPEPILPDLQSARRKQIEMARLAALEAEDRAAEQETPSWGRNFPKAESSLPLDRTRIITADRVINAVLERGVDSSVPGPVVAVVETNVYGADGRLVLIPAGSRIIGACRALANAGQYRVQIEFTRILRPDGAQILIGSPAADAMGRLGLPGDLDQRVLDRAGVPLLVSVIGAVSLGLAALSGAAQTQVIGGGGIVTTQTGSPQSRAIAQAGQGLGTQFAEFATKLLEERADVRPIVRLAQGARLLIVPTSDVWLNDKGLAAAARTTQLQRLRTAEIVDDIEQHVHSQGAEP